MLKPRKVLYLIALAAFFLTTGFSEAKACEIEYSIVEGKKEVYAKGDIVIVKVKVTFTHRICNEGITNTEFSSKGLKILGATNWVETGAGVWERKLKMEVTAEGSLLKLDAVRTCEKDGGAGSITFKAG